MLYTKRLVLLLIETTLNNQSHSSFPVSSQLQTFILVFCFQRKAAAIQTQSDLCQKEIILSNNRWSRIWVFCSKVQELNHVIKDAIFPSLFCVAGSPQSHKVSRTAHSGSGWHGRENSRAANVVVCFLAHLQQKKWKTSPQAINLTSSPSA